MSLIWPIALQAVRSPRRVAVIDDMRRYTYAQLIGGAMFLAERIETATRAPRVGVLLPTSGAGPLSLCAIWMARKTAVPFNFLLAEDELNFVIEDSEVDVIISARAMIEHIGGESRIPDGVKLLYIDDVSFEGLPPLRWPPFLPNDDIAVILYTSGTVGRPKGVMLTHGNLQSNVEGAIAHAQLTEADKFLGVLPQFHSFGLTALTLMPLRLGTTVIYSARFIPKRIVDLIRKYQPGIFMAVPSMYGAILAVKEAGPDDFASVRLPISGGEPLPEATYEAFKQKFAVRLLEGYGLTETSPVATWCTPTMRKRGSVGTPLPGVTLRTIDDFDNPLPDGTEGELLIAGPNIMPGYLNRPEDNAKVFLTLPNDDRRYFRTGDIARIDNDGFLYITGRKKEMLIIGGENVFPREIEEVLNRHESVRDSAIIGRPDGMRGEIPIAFVEIKEDHAFDETALRSWCREHLANYKVPREIKQLDELPRSPTGKVLRRKLKDE